MGYYMFAYGVKTPEIKAVFGSKDEALLQKVKANDTFKNYADEDDDNETSKALTDIIMGNQYDEEGYIYGYAFIGICAALGVELPYNPEIQIWYQPELISRVLLDDWNIKTEIDTELFPADHFHPFSIPEIDDFPMISLLDKERLQALSDLLSKVHKTPEEIEAMLDGDDGEKGFAYEHIMGLKENIAFCLENGLDMVAFCH